MTTYNIILEVKCGFCKGEGNVPISSYWGHYPLTDQIVPCPYCNNDKESNRRKETIAKGLPLPL